MKKVNKRRLIVLILILVILIVEIKAFTDSMASKLLDITANIVDNSSLLSDQEYQMKAITGGESGYYITLPEMVNNKKISKYIIEQKEIKKEQKEESTNTNVINDSDGKVENTINTVNSNDNNNSNSTSSNITNNITTKSTNTINTVTDSNNTNTESNETTNKIEKEESKNITTTQTKIEKKAGENLYLTEEEIENKKINLVVEYDKKEKNEKTLYKTSIEQKINNNNIKIDGYMPYDAQIKIEERNNEEVEKELEKYMSEKTTLKVAYDIKIISEEKEYEPNEFDENMKVTITGIDPIDEENQKYRVMHIEKENIQEVIKIETKENGVSFEAESFSTYAVMLESLEEDAPVLYAANYSTNDVVEWDGSIATNFPWGDGTESTPYLISNGSELAYLAQQVNSGNTYEGSYFQIANDIDLGGREWNPIGDAENSFMGILDGAGRTIKNAKITIPEIPTYTFYTYGIFGSLGGGNSKTTIRNLELSGINIDITASGTTSRFSYSSEGLRIGCLSGTIYKNTDIQNIIVKDSNITDSNRITVYSHYFQLAIGGIIGCATNTSSSDTDPGSDSRYSITNCFSNVTITIDATASISTSSWNRRDGRGNYHTGGIIGSIRSQPKWPDNCLYSGSIQSNGFIGPIFAALVNNNANLSSSSGFGAVWNGNGAGNLTTNNAYYTNYSAAGTTFTRFCNIRNLYIKKE